MNHLTKWTLALAAGVLLTAGAGAEDRKPADKVEKKDDKAYTTDADFLAKAAQCGMHEVEEGKLAVANAKSEDVKKFGQQMIDDHKKANEALMATAKAAGVTVPDKADAEHKKHIDMLKDLKGEEFDRAFVKHAVEDHQKAVECFTQASKEAKSAEVKKFAADTLPTLEKHLEMAKKLDKGSK